MALEVDRLLLSAEHRRQMLAHVYSCLPEEGCGLLGGEVLDEGPQTAVRSCAVREVPNQLHSPVRFRMAPEEQFAAFQWFEANGLELIAIFHSHPTGPERPSPTDLAEFAYPGVLTLIWSPAPGGWQVRAFRIAKGGFVEVPIVIEKDDFAAGGSNPSPAEGL